MGEGHFDGIGRDPAKKTRCLEKIEGTSSLEREGGRGEVS